MKFLVTLSSLVGSLLFYWIAIKDSGGSVNYRQVGNVIFKMPLRRILPLVCKRLWAFQLQEYYHYLPLCH